MLFLVSNSDFFELILLHKNWKFLVNLFVLTLSRIPLNGCFHDEKQKFFVERFFSKRKQIRRTLRICPRLIKNPKQETSFSEHCFAFCQLLSHFFIWHNFLVNYGRHFLNFWFHVKLVIFPYSKCIMLCSLYASNIRNLEVDGCPSKGNLFGRSTLLMNALSIVFPLGNLWVYGKIIESGIYFYTSILRLNEPIT